MEGGREGGRREGGREGLVDDELTSPPCLAKLSIAHPDICQFQGSQVISQGFNP